MDIELAIILPVFAILLLANILAISAWRKSNENPFSFYFLWISIFDLLSSITFIPQVLGMFYFSFPFANESEVVCKGQYYLTAIAWMGACCLTPALALERTLTLPFIRWLELGSSRRRGMIVCAIIVVVAAILKLPYLIYMRLDNSIGFNNNPGGDSRNETQYFYSGSFFNESTPNWFDDALSSDYYGTVYAYETSDSTYCVPISRSNQLVADIETIIIHVIHFSLPLVVALVSQLLIVKALKKSKYKLKEEGTWDVTYVLCFVIVLFLAQHTCSFLAYLDLEVVRDLHKLIWLFGMTPVLLNPLFYLGVRDYRKGIVETFRCACFRNRGE